MSFQTPLTICKAIEKIDRREFLLPAIQRKFVWKTDDIELLFDSLMCDFPISSFLFWKVDNEQDKNNHNYYQFLTEYIEYHNDTAQQFNINNVRDFYAVLDGQQRLTALYLGLKGTYAYKKPYAHIDKLDNFPRRQLYLDICKKYKDYTDEEIKNIGEFDDDREYGFYFLTEQEFEKKGGATRFFKVGNILSNEYKNNRITAMMKNFSENTFAAETVDRLYNVVYNKLLINYYLEETDDYDKALKIFIRTNSGGERLSYSDLLISTIISRWPEARTEFDKLEKEIVYMGFYKFKKEYIVRCALMLYSEDIRFKTNNLSEECISKFKEDWDEDCGLKATIREAFTLLQKYGHNNNTITSYNAVVVIIYYLKIKGKRQFCEKIEHKDNRNIILKWLNMVLLKRIFGGQSDSLLKEMRDVIRESIGNTFPIEEIKKKLEGTGKSLSVDDEFLESLLTEQKDSQYAFPILALLYDGSDYRDTKHKDHLHPENSFTKKEFKNLNLSEEDLEFYGDRQNWNSILNLQLLYGDENKRKNKSSLREWVEENKIDCEKYLIPSEYIDFKDFRKFIEKRREILKKKLRMAFE